MPLFKITGQGLSAMAVLAALLWGCLLGTRAAERRAVTGRVLVMREIEQLQERTRPVYSPFMRHHRPRPIAV